ncbi:ATP-grasp domain-containing protein [Gaiella sp.]|uniref:ATP-grasp domain-containing protein n=1 Tax=Gaiella sp. TaxID=2663207 RepID=UPI002E38075B|nr:ATP-grasp domain-containing protein [Gaiella sp.]HEX5585516.1 ATP-grasp domain-containing protein [Gaiella sp.]
MLEAARARGDVHVIAVDRDPRAVGFPLAAERAVLSSEDEEAIDRLARARSVDGIVSPGADWPVGIAARVAERIGLAHPIDARTGALVTSKARQREVFAATGVPHARAFPADDPSLPLPAVVKAPDRQGQRGLALVRFRDDLPEAVAVARSESRTGTVLVEELVDGPEVTVNAISVDGQFVSLAVTDRLTAESPAFGVALAHVWPSPHEAGPIVEVAREAVEALGIRHGPSYTQLRLGPDGPVVMEVAARLGGGHDAELCEAATGVDLNGIAVAAALSEPLSETDVSACLARSHVLEGRVSETGMSTCQARGHGQRGRGAAVAFVVAPAGRLAAVDGLEDAEAADGVRWVRLYRRAGDVLRPLRRGADRAGAVLATGASRDEALERARRAADAVRFRVDADAP